MELFAELLKFTIPGLIVFATAYYLLKLMLDQRLEQSKIHVRQEAVKITLPLRLQAYERLILLCDRTEIPNVLIRVRIPGMTVSELQAALMLTIRQEFEHNTSQQLYVSNTLWQIVTLARNETLAIISRIAGNLESSAPADQLFDALLDQHSSMEQGSPLQKAAFAIRTEVEQLF